MSETLRIFLFGDLDPNVGGQLKDQLQVGRTNPLLGVFLQRVGLALRQEVSSQSIQERSRIPAFANIDELVKSIPSSRPPHTGILCALQTISQISQYLEYDDCVQSNIAASRQSRVIGCGIGLLAAAAVASSPSLSSLIPIAIDAVTLSYQVGSKISAMASKIDSTTSEGKCWSYDMVSCSEETIADLISSFHHDKRIPKPKEAYISGVSVDSVTLSGPPSTLQLLRENKSIGISTTQRHATGPFHAPHLFNVTDIEGLLEPATSSASHVLSQYTSSLPWLSSSSNQWIEGGTAAASIFRQAICDILCHKSDTRRIPDICSDILKAMLPTDCDFILFGLNQEPKYMTTLAQNAPSTSIKVHQGSSKSSSFLRLNQVPRTARRSKLAIVGMAGRFPDAADHEKLWELLEAGLDVHREIPKDRFDVKNHYDQSGKIRNTSHTPYGCFIKEPGLFDPRFFNMSPREALQTDPMHRLGLTSAYEALEMSGYVPNRTPSTCLDRIGTFYGQTSDDWREINAAQEVDTYFITGGVRAFAPGRINYHFKFTGPSFSVDTACSSSAAAIQLACTSLWAGDCDTAVTGGLNVMTNSDIFAGLSRGQFLSKTGNCQTYDNDADGYCRGDGIGTLIIKRYEDAIADNDRILGVILETETNHSSNAISITHPHAETQEILFQKVMEDSGVDPHDVSYVEMHGTGTQAGDGTEMRSVTNIFAPSSRKGTRVKPLHLGSVKANVGHGEAVSGVTALIKVLLMLDKSRIPPHCGIKKTINQTFPQDLQARNVHIAFKSTPLLTRDGSPRRIFVNNFSAAGGNTATLLEDAPRKEMLRQDPRSEWVVCATAKSKTALKANLRRLIEYIDANPQTRLEDLAYTTSARRIQHAYRVAVSSDSLKGVREALVPKVDTDIDPIPTVKPSVAFAFTGQGSHYTGLGRNLYQYSTQYRAEIIGLDKISRSLGYPSFLPLITGENEAVTLSPLIIQLGLCSIQMALVSLWSSWGIKPEVVVGHSLGEYAALNAAGVISASDALYLVGERAKLLQEHCTANSHAMIAAKASAGALKGILATSPEVEVACINAPQETVLSGPVGAIDTAVDALNKQGIKCTKLNTAFAFHSSQVDPILQDFEAIATAVPFSKPTIPVLSPLLAGTLSEADVVDAAYLCRHAREAVNFSGSVVAAQQLGLVNDNTIWIEIGPHPVCLGFIKSEFGPKIITAPSLRRDVSSYKTLSSSLACLHTSGVTANWNEYHKDFVDCLQMLDLPTYCFDSKNYWIQYTGDWNLSKGGPTVKSILPQEKAPSLSTTTVQRVISENIDGEKASLITESDISRPDLFAAISGHLVNGTPLCPSSIYGDMALTVCDHLYKLLRPGTEKVHMNVCHMEVFKPLIANTAGGKDQVLRLATHLDLSTSRATLLFSSGSGKAELQHAKCYVDFGSGESWLEEWQRNAYLIRGRIDSLKEGALTGKAHKLLRGMAYKLFTALVDYDAKFRGMEEVLLDSPAHEATSKVVFQTTEADGKFFCSPYWIDSVAHLAGFIVNANDALDSGKQVYISHGWGSMRFAEPLSADKTYRSYVKMQPAAGNVMSGDVYIFDGDRIVGMVGALKFQCIPRTLLNTFLPPRGMAASAPAAQVAAKPVPKAITTTPTKKTPAKMSIPTVGPSVTTRTLDVIASEVGVETSELADAINLAEMGVDSLMSLSITGRLREELELELSSTLFTDYPTVADLKGHLKQFESKNTFESPMTDGSSTPDSESDASSNSTGMSTPTTPGSPLSASAPDDLSAIIRDTICSEMEIDLSDLMSTNDLGAIGMDSLMSLSILGALREKTGLSLSSTFLTENPSIVSIEKTLQIGRYAPTSHKQPSTTVSSVDIVPIYKPSAPAGQVTEAHQTVTVSIPVSTPERFATSVLLQGTPKTATQNLWLIPDGSGSATSYIFMPEIAKQTAVWGLNSPFMKTPEEYHCGVTGMATHFIKEIKRRQPQGPYHIGGWSAGGVISFETVRQLIEAGDLVGTLILIDTPCPLIIEPLPSSLHRFFGEIGLLGEGDGALERLPPWLLPHFAASVTALSTYTAKRLPEGKTPRVMAIWCEDGVCKHPEDKRPDPYPYGHAQWLLENRSDFGPNLWDEYMDKSRIECRQLEGNHFSMMRAPYAEVLARFLGEAMGWSSSSS